MDNIATEETYQDGQTIFEEGKFGDWIYVILTGSVEISRILDGEKYVIAILNPGEIFGELGFLGGIKRTATATAIGETLLGTISRDFLDNEFNKINGYFRSILVTVVDRFKQLIDRTSNYSSRTAPRIDKTISLEFKDRLSVVMAITANIGEGGLFIKTDKPLNEGDHFMLKMRLPHIPEPLNIESEVVWRRPEPIGNEKPAGMGVKFLSMSEKDNHVLKWYVNANLIDK
jgi:uncharacterized protein (TIGR02266 family)